MELDIYSKEYKDKFIYYFKIQAGVNNSKALEAYNISVENSISTIGNPKEDVRYFIIEFDVI